MREQNPETSASLSALGEALLKAAEGSRSSSELSGDILEKSESLKSSIEAAKGRSEVTVNVSIVDFHRQAGTEEVDESENPRDDITSEGFFKSTKRPAPRSTEPEFREKQANNPNRSERYSVKNALRQLSATTNQIANEALRQRPEEQFGLIVASQQEADSDSTAIDTQDNSSDLVISGLTPQQQKEERRKAAQMQRAANLARKDTEKQAKKEVRNLPQEAKEEFRRFGRDYFNFATTPLNSVTQNRLESELKESWQGLISRFPDFTPAQQAELVRQMSLGMEISEHRVSNKYIKTLGTHNKQGEKIDDCDYFLHMMAIWFDYHGELRILFVNAIRSRLPQGHANLPAVQNAFAKWLADYKLPQH